MPAKPSRVDMAAVAAILKQVADAEILPRWRNLDDEHVREKTGPSDLVTVADEASEQALSALLTDLLPGSVVVGEEGVAADPARLDLLRGAAPAWIIDPVDGTNNFAKGDDKFAVMVALSVADRTVASWIHEPVTGRTAMAAVGEGAELLTADGGRQRLRVADPAPLDRMSGAFSLRFLPEPVRKPTRAACDAAFASHVRLGCAGVEYLRLVTGKAHFSFYWKTMPWDHAPGLLIHSEAGGHNARAVDGRAYRPSELTGGLLAAPDEAGWRAIQEGPVRLAVAGG